MQQSVDIWHNTIRHQTTVAFPVTMILRATVRVISETSVYEKNGEVDWVEVRQNVMKTCSQNTSKLTLCDLTNSTILAHL